MKKILYILAVAALLVGCKAPSDYQTAERQASTAHTENSDTIVNKSKLIVERDLTVKVNSINPKQYKKSEFGNMVGFQPSYIYDGMTVEGIKKNSTDIIVGCVDSVEYIQVNGNPYIKYDVIVSEVYKGNLKKADKISVALCGGYITKKDYLSLREPEYNPKADPDANKILTVKNMDAEYESELQVGKIYLFGLRELPAIKGCYFPIMDNYTIYQFDESDKFTRFPGKIKKSGKQSKGNTDESFTSEWIKEKFSK